VGIYALFHATVSRSCAVRGKCLTLSYGNSTSKYRLNPAAPTREVPPAAPMSRSSSYLPIRASFAVVSLDNHTVVGTFPCQVSRIASSFHITVANMSSAVLTTTPHVSDSSERAHVEDMQELFGLD
jgi:hypothetical protein